MGSGTSKLFGSPISAIRLAKIVQAGVIAGFLVVSSPLANAQTPPASAAGGQTAEELLQSGTASYNTGDWAAAEASFQKFIADFGSNAQAAEAVPRVKPLLALCQVRLKKFAEALPTIEQCLKEIRTLAPAQKEKLSFWLGICQMQADDYAQAQATFQQFATSFPNSARRVEALILSGTLLVIQQKWNDALQYFNALQPLLRGTERGRVVILILYAELQADKLDDALTLVTTELHRTNDIIQLAGFQMLALELGSKFLDKGEYRKAIAALQRVWSRDRVLKNQEARLTFLKDRLAALNAQKADIQATFQIAQLITKIDRELTTFREIKNYDSALQLRLASAFQGLERYREAALIMDAMLTEMPPDPLVEQASLNLLQCWSAIERWPKVVEAADAFEKKFPKSAQLPTALFLKGQAQQSDFQYEASNLTFQDVVKRFPSSTLAPRALFMSGFGELLQDKYAAALKIFEEVSAKYPKDQIAEAAWYWSGMALSMDKQHEKSREKMADYATRYKNGQFISQAAFRRAYCAQSLKDYKTSITELKAYLKNYPTGEQVDEALVLLGDAYMAEGDVDRGIETFKRIDPKNRRFFEEGWFKIGKALRLQEKVPQLRAHMMQFRQEHSDSPRVAEAIYWIGWTYRTEEKPEEARTVYWDAIQEFGNDPKKVAVEDLFSGVGKLYKGDEEKLLLDQKLKDLQEEAEAKSEKTLLIRTLWARAQLLKKKDPLEANRLLEQAGTLADVSTTNPLLLADFADATRELGGINNAEALYKGMLKWNPRAPQKDRAFAGLGWIALTRHENKKALEYFDRFDKETLGSPLQGTIQLARTRLLLERGEKDRAKEALEALLANKFVAGKEKAEALYMMGEILMEQGKPGEAIAYYQRIYVMYGRWVNFVAKGYLRSGEAFEKINDKESAINTYQEMVKRDDLATFEETSKAKQNLATLEAAGNS